MSKTVFFLVFVWLIQTAAQAQDTAPSALLLAEHALYQVTLDGSPPIWLHDAHVAPPPSPTPTLDFKIAPAPLFGPVVLRQQPPLFLMSGADNPFVNFYTLNQNGTPQALSDVVALFPDHIPPILSASVEFIAWRPAHDGFLFRARLRDSSGQDHNALFWHDGQNSQAMPYFGKNPVWSPNGLLLAGSRLETRPRGQPPLYGLWVVDVESGAEQRLDAGCNPQWSPDGAWLAYEGHVESQWQGYTDCFASGTVFAHNWQSGAKLMLSAGLNGHVALIGWLD